MGREWRMRGLLVTVVEEMQDRGLKVVTAGYEVVGE